MCGGIGRLDGVAAFINHTVDFEIIALGSCQHELPEACCAYGADGRGVEGRLDDGQVFQFERQAIIIKGFFEDGHVEIASAEHIGNAAAQVV